MPEWWTYRPEDFLLFSPRVYWRLIELHNQALWPWQLLALLLGGLVLAGMLRPRPWSNRLIAALLAVAWVFVAWTFLWQRYSTINWAVVYVVPLFVLQALLLIGLGTHKGELSMPARWSIPRILGIALFLYALLLHPLLPIVVDRSLHTAEVVGIFPDPLAIATLGMLAMATPGQRAWPLMVAPVLWCLVSWLTLDTMQARGAWVPLLAVVIAVVGRLWGRVR